MFLTETVTVSKQMIKQFGATGAVILQTVYSEYGPIIPLDVDTWSKSGGILDYIQPEIIKRTLTGLQTKGLITITDNEIILDAPKKQVKQARQKVERKANPVYEMAVCLSLDIFGESKELSSPDKYLKFAKRLIEGKNMTKERLLELYGENSWWKNTWKGQQGIKPTMNDIVKTIDDALANKSDGKEINAKDGFWS